MPQASTSQRISAPRRFACSYSSSTRIAAPSLRTKPSRSASYGREAVCGESLRVESARMFANPAIASSVSVPSAPPAIMTSAMPFPMIIVAIAIEWLAVAHAVCRLRLGPVIPYMMLSIPEAMLPIDMGM